MPSLNDRNNSNNGNSSCAHSKECIDNNESSSTLELNQNFQDTEPALSLQLCSPIQESCNLTPLKQPATENFQVTAHISSPFHTQEPQQVDHFDTLLGNRSRFNAGIWLGHLDANNTLASFENRNILDDEHGTDASNSLGRNIACNDHTVSVKANETTNGADEQRADEQSVGSNVEEPFVLNETTTGANETETITNQPTPQIERKRYFDDEHHGTDASTSLGRSTACNDQTVSVKAIQTTNGTDEQSVDNKTFINQSTNNMDTNGDQPSHGFGFGGSGDGPNHPNQNGGGPPLDMKHKPKVVEHGQEHTGRWTREEHEAFLLALQQYGKEWKKVAAKVKTRTAVQTKTHAQKYFQKLQKGLAKILARYDNQSVGSNVEEPFVLNETTTGANESETITSQPTPQIERKRWTQEEKQLLVDGIQRYGKDWGKVAGVVATRDAVQCCNRYYYEKRHDQTTPQSERKHLAHPRISLHETTRNTLSKEDAQPENVNAIISKAKKASVFLWILLHAQVCTAQDNQCIHTGCAEAKRILQHIKSCPSNADFPCPSSHNGCQQSRKLLSHYHKCREIRSQGRATQTLEACLICSLLARHDKTISSLINLVSSNSQNTALASNRKRSRNSSSQFAYKRQLAYKAWRKEEHSRFSLDLLHDAITLETMKQIDAFYPIEKTGFDEVKHAMPFVHHFTNISPNELYSKRILFAADLPVEVRKKSFHLKKLKERELHEAQYVTPSFFYGMKAHISKRIVRSNKAKEREDGWL